MGTMELQPLSLYIYCIYTSITVDNNFNKYSMNSTFVRAYSWVGLILSFAVEPYDAAFIHFSGATSSVFRSFALITV